MSEETVEVEIKGTPLENVKHELFVQFYVKNSETRRNATLCYAEAYEYKLDELSKDDAKYIDIRDEEGEVIDQELIEKSSYDKAYNVCAVEGHRVLKSPKVQARIIEVLNEYVTDSVVDSELGKIILQDKELPAKNAAIKTYNDIKGRVIKKTDLTTDGDKIEGVVVLPAKE